MPLTVMPIYGTRPEAIKMAPIVKALQDSDEFQCVVTVTGQHREMLDQVNEIFDITPDHDLNIIRPRQTLNGVLTRTVEGLDAIFEHNAPDAVVVQGDTTTSTAGAIAAFYRGIPVIHAEAGLRSFDLFSPFPEEANRKMTSQITSLHLAPTDISKRNLTAESINGDDIVVTGNTVIDALHHTVAQQLPFTDPALEELAASGRRVLLVTTHRRENQGDAMRGVGRALARIARDEPELTIVLPAHRNPVVREAVLPALEGLDNVLVTEPLAYGEFTRLLGVSHVVLTDSGGVQEEAPSLGKPVLVMRENTERPEAVTAGTVKLIGTDEERIVEEVSTLLHNGAIYDSMANAVNPYGDGRAAERTVAAIAQLFGVGERLADFDPEAQPQS
ncbi:UDP-N-acetylglucosamine 2-epimerase (non-hydrolyzing) [Kocuria palustris]|jgi:UDP-N-acetylglucosamine 2-epimerase (non-hydrolysing)|uniref:non-hydrolyzing UDP-N-acetylglucosamine 2-epimerase n=1 Tax=Kocuria palustris TaxID=71999 RepID=UPI0019D13D23|nr:UDP-N-acetylglucosamine 2-epimerase (non-hydrolyzing) [Kocuria palustris]MBN6754225.1 UDP-N-acetylglucosamine 2-epimerase (non-hydrolyzing) [Kocuria palustris]MBN6758292.1 UDP-N-acetylglucosamine 2-epimerase (non-hydrolyzing) [Kocuria palustris]MBN6763320.1 UDP-N-acetylglucosamine 2-epimerase (non-hydrolyzing) [Kocuria palustris]MBN6783282.1 UDP-N-acetylglucosamine 2-epimerase (non-hydrolyzing) [Kocuria palustris]MBN6798835.1 UDP-N-acetylglucosamine 2-epimerase (non-hydrolyzing) [Kocuria pa